MKHASFSVFIFLAVFVFTSSSAQELPAAQNVSVRLTLSDVLQSTLARHPKIHALAAKLEQVDGKRLSAQGNFDWKLDYDQQTRTGGFYDGWFGDPRLSRQLGWANAKVTAGYRISGGDFPVYEAYHETLEDGEPNLKLSLSLLRYRQTDPNRQAIFQSDLDFLTEEQIQALEANDLLRDAAFHYIDWHQAFLEVQVMENLLLLAEQRNKAIEERVKSGDLARFVETEFRTTLFERQAAVLQNKQKLAANALKLSLYWRDEAGAPKLPDSQYTPSLDKLFFVEIEQQLGDLPTRMQSHPQIKAFDLRAKQLEAQRQLAQSELLPTLDLNLRVANDLGNGSETLDGTESYVGLQFSLPLERRKAKGKLISINAESKALKFGQQNAQEQMRNFFDTELLNLENLFELLTLQEEQAALAKRLAELEQLRFNGGDSDLFLLNARETSRAMAELSVVKTRASILKKQINLAAEAALLLPIVNVQPSS